MSEALIADLSEGDLIQLDRYLKGALRVDERRMTSDGPVLIVESTGETPYRLRAIDDDDDRLLLEKGRPKGWEPHLRVNVERA